MKSDERLTANLPSDDDQAKLAELVHRHGISRILVALGYIQREEKRIDDLAVDLGDAISN